MFKDFLKITVLINSHSQLLQLQWWQHLPYLANTSELTGSGYLLFLVISVYQTNTPPQQPCMVQVQWLLLGTVSLSVGREPSPGLQQHLDQLYHCSQRVLTAPCCVTANSEEQLWQFREKHVSKFKPAKDKNFMWHSLLLACDFGVRVISNVHGNAASSITSYFGF